MSDDNEIIEDYDRQDQIEADESLTAEVPPRRSKGRLFIPVLGLIAALGAGGLGGFAVYKYYDSARPVPDFSNYEAQIDELDKAMKAQEARADRLQNQFETVKADLNSDLTALDERWAQQILELTNYFANTEKATGGEDVPEEISNAGQAENPSLNDTAVQSGDDIPDLQRGLTQLRRDVGRDIDRIKTRLDILEQVPDIRGDDTASSPQTPASLPIDDILNQVETSAAPTKKPRWYDKFLNQHVSLERTDYDNAKVILQRIDDAISRGDWDVAMDLSQDLDEPTRMITQEWIAGARL